MIACMRGTSWMVAFRIMELSCVSLKADTCERCECLSAVTKGKDEFNLDRRIKGEGIDAHRRADVLPRFAEQFEEELARAVGHLGLLGKAHIAVDEGTDPGDAIEPVESVLAKRGDGGKGVDDALAGGGFGVFDGAAGR